MEIKSGQNMQTAAAPIIIKHFCILRSNALRTSYFRISLGGHMCSCRWFDLLLCFSFLPRLWMRIEYRTINVQLESSFDVISMCKENAVEMLCKRCRKFGILQTHNMFCCSVHCPFHTHSNEEQINKCTFDPLTVYRDHGHITGEERVCVCVRVCFDHRPDAELVSMHKPILHSARRRVSDKWFNKMKNKSRARTPLTNSFDGMTNDTQISNGVAHFVLFFSYFSLATSK